MLACLMLTTQLTLAAAAGTVTDLPAGSARALDTSGLLARFEAAEAPPLAREIQAALDSSRAAEAALAADPLTTPDQKHAALCELRRATRLRVLQIQAAHAENSGSAVLAARIRARIETLKADPRPRVTRVEDLAIEPLALESPAHEPVNR